MRRRIEISWERLVVEAESGVGVERSGGSR